MYDLIGPSDMHDPCYHYIHTYLLTSSPRYIFSWFGPLDKGRFFGTIPRVSYTCIERVGNERRPFALKIIDEYCMTPAC
jgi:hypothetical protein